MSEPDLNKLNSFENENTFLKAVENGLTEDFHEKYENAVIKTKNEMGKTYPNYVNGEPIFSNRGLFKDTSPADMDLIIGYFQAGSREDVKEAIIVAKESFLSWSLTPYENRVSVIRKIIPLLVENKFEISAIMSLENGKNRFESVADVDESIDLVRYYCMLMESNNGFMKTMGQAYENEDVISSLKPYGVWGVIAPFNFLALTIGMCTGALVTGNTVVYKPSSDTPLMGLKYYELLVESGLPNGVLNFIAGPGSIVGPELINNVDVSGLIFTGSREVGVSSYLAFNTKMPRPFIAEMGGKNPVYVSEKANLDKAANGVASAAFGFAGQKCSACSRVYVHGSVKDEFVSKLIENTRGLKIGDPTKRESYVAPLINNDAYKKFRKYSELSSTDGNIILGGKVLTGEDQQNGYYVEPTIVENLPSDHEIVLEELFIPILTVLEVNSIQEALTEANSSEYGLTAGIFSEDQNEVQEFFNRIQAGVVYANRKMSATTGANIGSQAFTGWKLSGSTGKGAGGIYYLHQFLREQSQTIVK